MNSERVHSRLTSVVSKCVDIGDDAVGVAVLSERSKNA